ncbi:putative R3H domain protein [Aureobasidium pullulans]|nr:putative R3H domain protein [Aureobasidium pullulans]
MSLQQPDMYYDNPASRSPHAQRHQPQLHRQSSRQFDSYAHLPSGLYGAEDQQQQQQQQQQRFDAPRYNDRMGAPPNMHQNMNQNMNQNYGGYDMGGQNWNNAAFGNNTLGALGGSQRRRGPQQAPRNGLPSVSNNTASNQYGLGLTNVGGQAWLDQPQPMPQVSPYLGLGGGVMGAPSIRSDQLGSEPDEELIPTAIVIKNIPFAVKKEQLVQLMTDMGLPLPYAFNYHFDNGVFRGLAFANFTSPDETAAVIDAMNHFELQGRKLRVEYKKMLPAAERERIEREKRERRGQLEEQHRPMASQTLQTQTSMSSLTGHLPPASPSPVSAGNVGLAVDLNNPDTLKVYSDLLIFKEDKNRDLFIFPSNLSPPQRRVIHTISHHMGLAHISKGQADQRAVHVYKEAPRQRLSPPMPQIQAIQQGETQRRGLNRAATTDFTDVRNQDAFYHPTGVRHQQSGYLSGFQDAPSTLAAGPNLRAAKSFADLRSYTPSPVPSTASFPATLGNNVSRFAEYARENGGTPAITPTGSAAPIGTRGDENMLVNGLGNMNIGGPAGFASSPRGLRGMMSWDRESNPGPIGGHRSFSTNNTGYDEQPRDRNQGVPSRQPRGPMPERGSGFPRRNGHMARGSDELSQQSGVEITVE